MQETTFLHYKNGIFHGQKNNQKQGTAICYYDNGAVFIGQYLANQPSGKCLIILSPELYFMGSLKKGLLEGPFALRSPYLHIYAHTKDNRIHGEVVVVDKMNKRARVWQIQNSEGVCIREAEYEEHLSQQKILRAISPYTDIFPSLLEYFLKDRCPSGLSIFTTQGKKKTQICINDLSPRKLAVHLEPQRLLAVGITEQGSFNGLAYICDKQGGIEIEGEIKKGMLDGEGIKRQIDTGKTIFGKFSKGDIRTLEVMDAKNNGQGLLTSMKKRIHLHALEYTNDYLNQRPVYLLRNFYETMQQNEGRYDKYLSQYGTQRSNRPNSIGLNRQSSKNEMTYNIGEYNLIKQALSSRR